jgi:hypothetical protein
MPLEIRFEAEWTFSGDTPVLEGTPQAGVWYHAKTSLHTALRDTANRTSMPLL